MNKYIYPDNGDKITTFYINKESNNEYWEESEKNILKKIIRKIQELDTKPDLLDLGCGIGRLFSTLYPYVKSITAVEPDLERFREAQREAQQLDSNRIQVFNNNISLITKDKYKAVLISHVLQHIQFEEIKNILKNLKNIIDVGGLLFITTTFTKNDKDSFMIRYIRNNEIYSDKVSELEFIKRFNEENVLPIRLFSYNTMKSLFYDNDFVIEEMFAYHFETKEIGNILNIEFDELMNKKKIYDGAIDVMYILRRV